MKWVTIEQYDEAKSKIVEYQKIADQYECQEPPMSYEDFKKIVRHIPKRLFGKIAAFGQGNKMGFGIDRINLKFDLAIGIVTIIYFPDDSDEKESDYIIPRTESDLLKKLRHHCGDEAINKLLIKQ